MPEWKNTDPRDTHSYNSQVLIVILRMAPTGIFYEAGTGVVDTKHDWYIITSFEDHGLIKADEKWDQDWIWIEQPERNKK